MPIACGAATVSDQPVPYRHVLVGTDGSATAGEAVRHAAKLAIACGARLTIVSAYTRREGSPGELVPPDEDDWMATDAAGASDHVVKAQELAKEVGLTNLGGRTDAGDPASVLLDVATEVGADVIVIGSRGMSAPTRFLLGSVPNRVSHHAPCDIIIVRTSD
jgi:nucleotide-binding universal stress UspA family protein